MSSCEIRGMSFPSSPFTGRCGVLKNDPLLLATMSWQSFSISQKDKFARIRDWVQSQDCFRRWLHAETGMSCHQCEIAAFARTSGQCCCPS